LDEIDIKRKVDRGTTVHAFEHLALVKSTLGDENMLHLEMPTLKSGSKNAQATMWAISYVVRSISN